VTEEKEYIHQISATESDDRKAEGRQYLIDIRFDHDTKDVGVASSDLSGLSDTRKCKLETTIAMQTQFALPHPDKRAADSCASFRYFHARNRS
jgi:hypothetical protein